MSDFFATSVPTLLKHYGHHNPDHQNKVAAVFGACPRAVIGIEDRAVHRCFDHPWGNKAIASHAHNQSLGAPMAKGSLGKQTLAFLAPSTGCCHLGVGAGLFTEDQPPAMFTLLGLVALSQNNTYIDEVRLVLFECPKCCF